MSMFRTHTDLQRIPNKNNHIQTATYNCELCEEGAWMSESEVEIHKKNAHHQEIWNNIRDKKKFACSICAKPHESNEELHEHIKTIHLLSSKTAEHIEREIFICDHCCRIFFNKTLLEIHIARKHPNEVTNKIQIQCPKCCKVLKKSCIWGHFELHLILSISTCPICLEKCANRLSLREHLNKHRKYYYCGICRFNTRKEDSFKLHLNEHRKGQSSMIKKSIVLNHFVPKFDVKLTKYSIQNVTKGIKLPNGVHICIICRYICVDLKGMTKHLRSEHMVIEEVQNKKVYMCACGQEFFNNILLKQHVFKEKGDHRVLTDQEIKEMALKSEDAVLETEIIENDLNDYQVVMLIDTNDQS